MHKISGTAQKSSEMPTRISGNGHKISGNAHKISGKASLHSNQLKYEKQKKTKCSIRLKEGLDQLQHQEPKVYQESQGAQRQAGGSLFLPMVLYVRSLRPLVNKAIDSLVRPSRALRFLMHLQGP